MERTKNREKRKKNRDKETTKLTKRTRSEKFVETDMTMSDEDNGVK